MTHGLDTEDVSPVNFRKVRGRVLSGRTKYWVAEGKYVSVGFPTELWILQLCRHQGPSNPQFYQHPLRSEACKQQYVGSKPTSERSLNCYWSLKKTIR